MVQVLFENATETLTWLTSILAVDKAKARFVHGDGRKIMGNKAWLPTNSFKWIWLRDGRSYIFPGKRDFKHKDFLKLYNAQTLAGRMLKYILEFAICFGIKFPYIKQLHLVVTNIIGGDQASSYLLTEYLKEVLGRDDLLFAFSCGTPGPQRKPVISIIDNSGRALAYTKIGWNDCTNSLVRKEHDVLDMLNQRCVFHTLKFPAVIWYGSWNAKQVLITRPGGKGGRRPRGLEPVILATLIEIGKMRSEDFIRIAWIETPLGPMAAGATAYGICLLEFTDRRMLEAQFDALSRRFALPIVPGENELIGRLRGELARYFAGALKTFSVPLEYPGTEFQVRVWRALLDIPFGETRSYEDVARAIGSRGAVRAVGHANGLNRIGFERTITVMESQEIIP